MNSRAQADRRIYEGIGATLVALGRLATMFAAAKRDGDPRQPMRYWSDFPGMLFLSLTVYAESVAVRNDPDARVMPLTPGLAIGSLLMLIKLVVDSTFGDRDINHLNHYETASYELLPAVTSTVVRPLRHTLRTRGWPRTVAVLSGAGFLGTFVRDMRQ